MLKGFVWKVLIPRWTDSLENQTFLRASSKISVVPSRVWIPSQEMKRTMCVSHADPLKTLWKKKNSHHTWKCHSLVIDASRMLLCDRRQRGGGAGGGEGLVLLQQVKSILPSFINHVLGCWVLTQQTLSKKYKPYYKSLPKDFTGNFIYTFQRLCGIKM